MPGDLSVVGFDDLEIAPYVGLTTVRQPLADSGRRAVERLLAALLSGTEAPHGGAARAQPPGAAHDGAARGRLTAA